MSKGLYIYGFMQEKKDAEVTGITGIDNLNPLFQIDLDNIYAVASDVDLDDFCDDEIKNKLKNMLWVEEKARTHYNIINRLSEDQIFIPVNFCTIFLNEENLKLFFSKYKNAIKEALEYMKDKEEWTFKVYFDKKALIENNIDEEKAKDKIGILKDKLWKELNRKVHKVKLNNNLYYPAKESIDCMILNSAILISKGKIQEICECLQEIKNKFELPYIKFQLVGPWPFYNFCELFNSY